MPDYPALLQPSVSVGKGGTAEGELYWATGVVVDEKTKLIYVADRGRYDFTGNISVFSITGEYIDRFCYGQVNHPYGIIINGDNIVFVSDSGLIYTS